jgi:hypothetical protein
MVAKVQEYIENGEWRMENFSFRFSLLTKNRIFCAKQAFLRNKRNNFLELLFIFCNKIVILQNRGQRKAQDNIVLTITNQNNEQKDNPKTVTFLADEYGDDRFYWLQERR